MKLKKLRRWRPTIIAIVFIIASYHVFLFAGVFNSNIQKTSALPDKINDVYSPSDQTYSLENVDLAVDRQRKSYYTWEREESGTTNIMVSSIGNGFTSSITCDLALAGGIISSSANGDRKSPKIAVNDRSNFVVVWADSSTTVAEDGFDIVFSTFNSDCEVQNSEVRVNTYTTGDQINPSVTVDNVGNFVIVWEGPCDNDDDDIADDSVGICARGFNDEGVALDAHEYMINSYTTGDQTNPDIVMDLSGSGDFVVVWSGEGADDSEGVYLQGYSSYGTPVSGGNQLVNITTTGAQIKPSIAVSKGDETLRYVVVWEGQGGVDTYGIYARRGTACSEIECPFANTELSVNTTTTGTQMDAAVDSNYLGDFGVTWRDGDYGESIKAQFFTAAGVLVGSEDEVFDNGFTALSVEGLGASSIGLSRDGYVLITDDFCNSGCGSPDTATLKWAAQEYGSFMYKTEFDLVSSNSSTTALGGVVDIDTAVNPNNGSYVVTWSGDGDDENGGVDDSGIWFSLVDKEGVVINSKQNVKVNTMSAGLQNRPKVSFFKDDGSFAICYDGQGDVDGDSIADDNEGIFYRRYDSIGNYLDTYEVLVNDETTNTYGDCDIAAGTGDAFVVVAENETTEDVFISREGLGVAGTDEYPLLDIGAATRANPSVSVDSSNNFVAVWDSNFYTPFDGEIHYVKGTLEDGFDTDVTETYVNDPSNSQHDPEVVLSENGRWFVTWVGIGPGGADEGIYLREFELGAAGEASVSGSGQDFYVTELVGGAESYGPAIATDGGDNLVITWFLQNTTEDDYDIQLGAWIYWDNTCCFVYKSSEFVLDESHFLNDYDNWYGPAYSAVGLYEGGELYIFGRSKDANGYNIHGFQRKLPLNNNPILSSTLEQEIVSGGRTLIVPDSLQFPAVTATAQSAITNTIAFEDNEASDIDYVEVQDLFADGNTYNVTISISTPFTFDGTASGCTDNVFCITNNSLEVRNYDQDGDRFTTLFGSALAFDLNSSTDSFTSLTSQRTLATGVGTSVGRWRIFPELRLTIEPNVPPGTHSAVLTFSLN